MPFLRPTDLVLAAGRARSDLTGDAGQGFKHDGISSALSAWWRHRRGSRVSISLILVIIGLCCRRARRHEAVDE